MTKTNIAWSQEVWNPVTGCSHVSPGCLNCYAETLSLRRGWSKKPWTAQNAQENVVLHFDRLNAPLRWRAPRMVFVNSMSDLFHEEIPDDFIAEAFKVMALSARHTFQVLTKRPERMKRWFDLAGMWRYGKGPIGVTWPLPNVWLGVSVEDQRRAEERIPLLLETPAAVRWISAEPLLGPLALKKYLWPRSDDSDERGLDWVVIGGESGPDHRPMDVGWAEALAAQCIVTDTPVFLKQDSGSKPGKQGRISDYFWNMKQFPRTAEGP